MRVLVLAGGLAAICAVPRAAVAIEFFCNPTDLCAMVPKDGGGTPIYNHTDPDLPWVIGQTEVVSLAAGDYGVGVGAVGAPMVFVIEDGTLEVKDLGAGIAGFGAWMVLCDQATFRVQNSGFRSLADYSFEYPIFALGQSHIDFTDAQIHTLTATAEAANVWGALFQVMGGQSHLTVQKGTTTYGAYFPNPGYTWLNGAWELAVVHSATAQVRDAIMMGEFYVQGQADFSVTDSFWHDQFFEVCATDNYTLRDLPALCDISGGANGCMTAGHTAINYTLGPPNTPFTLTLTNDLVFSWAISTYEGSTAHVVNAAKNANLAVGLGGIHQNMQLTLAPGGPPTMLGLTDRTLDLQNAWVIGWMLWPSGTSRTTILPGSEVADVLPGDQAFVEARGSLLQGAQFRASPNTGIRLVDSTVNETADNTGGKLWAVRSSLQTPLSTNGPVWLADSAKPTTLNLGPNGTLYRVALTSPTDGLSVLPSSIAVNGTVRAECATGEVSPFPEARVELYDVGHATSRTLGRVTSPKDAVLLATWDATGEAPGDYEVRLYFDDVDGVQATAMRRVTILPPAADGAATDSGAPSDGGAADAGSPADGLAGDPGASPADGSTVGDPAPGTSDRPVAPGKGCSCAPTAAPSLAGWLVLALALSRRARRTAPGSS